MNYKIQVFIDKNGKSPFYEWLELMPDMVRARVQARILRMELGNLGDYKSVGHGVCEARLAFGAGYRIYFAFKANKILLLLAGGSKRTQRRDIINARRYWLVYKEGIEK